MGTYGGKELSLLADFRSKLEFTLQSAEGVHTKNAIDMNESQKMKTIFIVVIIGISVVSVGCEANRKPAASTHAPVVTSKTAATAPSPLAGNSATVLVHGLACPSCAQGVERQLKQIPGVERVSMDVVTGMVQVDWKTGSKVTEQDLRDAVRWGGGVYVKRVRP